jgi:hypothetical protein
MKKLLVLVTMTIISLHIQGKTCPGGHNISVKNASDNAIEVFVVHPQFCGNYSELDLLNSRLSDLKSQKEKVQAELSQQRIPTSLSGGSIYETVFNIGDAANLASKGIESVRIDTQITALNKQIIEHKANKRAARQTGQRVQPDYVCKTFTVEPGQTESESEFTSTPGASWFARSFEVHVWDEKQKKARYTTYVKPGCILTYPNDFKMISQ